MSILGKLQFWKKDEFASPSEQPTNFDLGQSYDPLQQPDPMRQDPMTHDPFAEQNQTYSQPFSSNAYPTQTAQFPGRQPMQQMQVPEQQYADHQEQPGVHPRDVELMLAKLDAIKSELDALHQRVRKIEQSTDTQSTAQKRYW